MKRFVAWIVKQVGSPEQRWPAVSALVGIGGIYMSLPMGILPMQDDRVRLVPIGMVLSMTAPLVWTHRTKKQFSNGFLAYLLLSVLTVFLLASLALLVRALPSHRESPTELLQSAASIWMTNVLVFACWYWRLDAGGPTAREQMDRHDQGAFLFPQMTMSPELLERTCMTNWKPGFFDYLFIAFTASTALSPTDSPVLSSWAKLLMMIQASISFTVIILLAARAVNIL